MSRCVLAWHRGDLRVHDHAALHAAVESGVPVLGVVILDPAILDATSQRRRALFAAGVSALRAAYRARGGELLVRRGDPAVELPRLALECSARHVHALRSYSPYGTVRDTAATEGLAAHGITLTWHDGVYVHPPGTVLTRDERAFSVYSPYARRWWELSVDAPLPAPARIDAPGLTAGFDVGVIEQPASDVVLPQPGEEAALRRLEAFVDSRLDEYGTARDRLDGSGSSHLSVDITLGTLSARVAYHRVAARPGDGARKFLSELAWRDFMADLLHHRPHMQHAAFKPKYSEITWNDDEAAFTAWRDGVTGIPVVDAAMRQLRATGWISSRARMVAAQFLTKHLRIDWRRGERVFRELLLDGDAASNIGNWQWSAGLGVDNAPYFRVFNPVTQGKSHDPDGEWLRRWVPESGGDPRPLPHAIVDLADARREYLAAMKEVP